MKRYHTVMTIAGSDSGGGAGIQADIKAISACGCFATSAITAITAQNTCGVTAIHALPISILEAQIRAVLDDIGADAVKIGMLHSREVIACVAGLLAEYRIANVVLDPVMVATSGDRLIEEDAVSAMRELLFPLARLITPNLPELRLLLDDDSDTLELGAAARRLGDQYGASVLAKAGHLSGTALEDKLYEHPTRAITVFSNRRIDTVNTHGTGCTLSSAIAAFLAQGLVLTEAVSSGIAYLAAAIDAGAAYSIGRGHGPVHHFHSCW